MTLTVDFARDDEHRPDPDRPAPYRTGQRRQFTGERLNGIVLPGNDWVINRPDGVMVIDVRLTLKTDDGAMIYMTYQGRFLAKPEAMARFSKGAMLEADEYSLAMTAKFECGDERYAWLNDVVAVGTGEQTATGPVYSIFEIG
jgi:Protein of unknown function (DUF3237)